MAMSGHPNPITSGAALHDAFDWLCSVQAECPSSVDVARMKAEFLAAYHDIHGTPLASRVFANIHRLNALGSLMPGAANAILNSPLGLAAARLAGLPTERPLPLLIQRRFSRWVTQPASAQAALIVDTFTEFNHPEVGHALLRVANALGLRLP
jgi:Fe-S oxidoreductase